MYVRKSDDSEARNASNYIRINITFPKIPGSLARYQEGKKLLTLLIADPFEDRDKEVDLTPRTFQRQYSTLSVLQFINIFAAKSM